MRDFRFGFTLATHGSQRELIQTCRTAEAFGYDIALAVDHLGPGRSSPFQSALAAALASDRLRVGTFVINTGFWNPWVLAREVATVQRMSGGRFELGLGAGSFWDAIAAMGGPRRSPGEAVAALEEAVGLLRMLWSDRPSVRFQGRHYRVAGLKPGPAPAHPIGIWVGAYRPRMLALVGRLADGWVPSSSYLPPERLVAAQARIDDAAAAAGRDPAAIRRLYNISGRIGPGGGGFLDGPPGQWVEQLLPLVVETGMDTFVVWPSESPASQLQVFAAEVAPALREAVAAHRGRG